MEQSRVSVGVTVYSAGVTLLFIHLVVLRYCSSNWCDLTLYSSGVTLNSSCGWSGSPFSSSNSDVISSGFTTLVHLNLYLLS